MPLQSSIQSNTLRTNHVAVAMGIVLLLSLGLAYIKTGSRRIHIDRLVLAIPKYWKQVPAPSPTPVWLNKSVMFKAKDEGSTTLMVSSLRSDAQRSPKNTLRQVLDALRVDHRQSSDTMRVQNLVGQAQAWWNSYLQGSTHQIVNDMHMLALLTDNGRHYWMIYLRKRVFGVIDPRNPPYPSSLFYRIMNTAYSERMPSPIDANISMSG